MLNKELLMGNTGGQQPVALTVGKYHTTSGGFSYGYELGYFGRLEPRPFWGNYTYLNKLSYISKNNYTKCLMTDRGVDVTVYVSGYQGFPISTEKSISGDPFRLAAKVGQTMYLTFDPPPLVTRIQSNSNRSRKRVLCRRSSLGGSRC